MKNVFKIDLKVVLFILTVMVCLAVVLFAQGNARSNGDVTNTAIRTSEAEVCNFLLLGTDKAAGLSDVIMLVSVNLSNGSINFMQIPRDTYFECGSTYKKLNGAPQTLGSVKAFAESLGDAMGIKINYYLSLGLEAVQKMVDFVSGIEVDVPFDMDYEDKSQNLSIHLKAGKQTLDGKSAVEFLRYRAGYITGDLGRINAQKLFMNAFVKRIGEMGNPLALFNICRLVLSNSETNIKESDIFSLCLKYARVKGGSVSYMTAPGEALQDANSGAWYYILSHSSMAELVCDRFGAREDKKDFDKAKRFVDINEKSFYDIYNKFCEVKIYSADDVENNEVNIN